MPLTGFCYTPNKYARRRVKSVNHNNNHASFHYKLDKAVFDSHGLTICPKFDYLPNLRYLSLQYNYLQNLKGIESLKYLVHINCYKNELSDISALRNLILLQVVILGRNKISRIDHLDKLVALDVLDLHANQIEKIENLSSLSNLRILNMANNRISTLENISQLQSLKEINLRRNRITSIKCLEFIPSVTKLFICHNLIPSLEEASKLSIFSGVKELSLLENPFFELLEEKSNYLVNFPNIEILNMSKVDNYAPDFIDSANQLFKEEYTVEAVPNDQNNYPITELTITNKNWAIPSEKCPSITKLTLDKVNFDEICANIDKIKINCPNIKTLNMFSVNLTSFSQVSKLSVLDKVEEITINEEKSRLWRLICFSALRDMPSLKTFNGTFIKDEDWKEAELLLTTLRKYLTGKIPSYIKRNYALEDLLLNDQESDSHNAFDLKLAQKIVQKCINANSISISNMFNNIIFYLTK